MTSRVAAASLTALAVAAGCGASERTTASSSLELKVAFEQGISEIRRSDDMEKLHARLLRTLARLRALHETTPALRRARALALRGFRATLRGVESRLSFTRNDSGNVEAATRDAIRADRAFAIGAALLCAAGGALRVPVRGLNRY